MSVTYIDAMDTTRFLRPVSVHKDNDVNNVICRVYWKEEGSPPQFGGMAKLPRKLFSQTQPIESTDDIIRLHQNDRCGFLPVVTLQAPKREELPDAPGFERDEEEEDED